MERLVPGGGWAQPREPGRAPRGAPRSAPHGLERRVEAVRAGGSRAAARRERPGARERRVAGGRRRQVGGPTRARPRRHGAPGLRPGGGRRPDREPHPVRGVLPREAGLLSRERRHLRLRDARVVRDPALPDVLFAAHRDRRRRRGAGARGAAALGTGRPADRGASRRALRRLARRAPHELRRPPGQAGRGPAELRRGHAHRPAHLGGVANGLRRRRLSVGHLAPQPPGLHRSHHPQ